MLANTNLGGDNVQHGAVLGVIVSSACGQTIDEWFERLLDFRAIESEVATLLTPR